MTEEQKPSPQTTKTEPAAEPVVSQRRKVLSAAFWLFVANCLVSWLLCLGYLRYTVAADDFSALGWLHFPLAYLAHFALLHLVVYGIAAALLAACPRRWALAVFYALVMPGLHLLLFIDGVVFTNYRTHFNGTILKMMTTPGAGDLFDFAGRDFLKVAGLILLLAGLEVGAALGLWRLVTRKRALAARFPRYALVTAAAVVAVTLFEKGLYAWSDATSRRDVLVNARVIPFYLPATAKHFFRKLGVKVDRQHGFSTSLALKYPLNPVSVPEKPAGYNVLWMVIDGWRFDALSPEVSPRLSKFSERCLVGERHYSSGNCTRFGIFGLFYGLDGFYWQSFLAEHQGPVMVKLLKQMDYDFLMMGSANFNNPEFLRTCFQDLDEKQVIHGKQLFRGKNYLRDLAMVERFGEFLKKRDAEKPFFCFMFLDATHSPYKFKELPGFKPPFAGYDEGVRHEKLAGDQRERRQAFVRYKNSVAYVDFMLGGALEDLEKRGLLEKTIVMITGDHGEEFGENGFFGHNGSFDDYQVKTPLIFYYPGVKPGRIKKLTSHLDLAPTTLRLLGVKSPPGDYCQGLDLLGENQRSYVVATSYSRAGIITGDGYRLAFPFEYYRISTVDIFDQDYREPADRKALLRRHVPKLDEVLKAAARFKR